jgi:hypothetical protein
MIICSASETHSALDRLYADGRAFEQALGMRLLGERPLSRED